ncbi:MAG: hypothetical protein E4H40_02285 [Candidatus Brocadiia bacterium]|nr:MAG: hypothetical protein E4H40_02285 [Candidatus Brocadiia bacterium]
MRKVRVAIYLPDFLCRIADSILQIYRRIRYGYAFRLIPLTQGKFAVVDPDDYKSLAQHTWNLIIDGKNNYAERFILKPGKKRKSTISMHREVMESPKDMCVDHINGNGLDNRRANLRSVTKLQNSWNRKKHPGNYSSRFKGVSRKKCSKKWRAKIGFKGKHIYLGLFDDEHAAARAYDAKARELYGKFASPNFQ